MRNGKSIADVNAEMSHIEELLLRESTETGDLLKSRHRALAKSRQGILITLNLEQNLLRNISGRKDRVSARLRRDVRRSARDLKRDLRTALDAPKDTL